MNKQHLTKRLSGFGQSVAVVPLAIGLRDLTKLPRQFFSHVEERWMQEVLAFFSDEFLSRCKSNQKSRGTISW